MTQHVIDAGFYGPGSEAWRLNREAMLLLGAGPRALLLQVAHPLVAAGVAEHSDFRADPWARLAGTLRSYLRIVYGTGEAARAEIRRLEGVHAPVRGEVREAGAAARFGRRYTARDPALALWVHATLVDSTLATYDAWIEPLSAARRAAAYAETLAVGRAFGIPADRLPPHVEAFDAYVAGMVRHTLEVGDTARDLADAILHPPLGPAALAAGALGEAAQPILDAVPRAAYGWLFWPAVGLLPERIREGYGLPWGLRQRAVAAWLVGAWRFWRPTLPPGFRQMPQALAADRRVGADRGDRDP